MQEGGDKGIYVYVQLIHFVINQKPYTIVKQLYSNKDVKKKKNVLKMLQKYTDLIREPIILKYSYQNISNHICDIVMYMFCWYIQ